MNGKVSSKVSTFGVQVKSSAFGLRFVTCSIYQMRCLCDGRNKLPTLFELIGRYDLISYHFMAKLSSLCSWLRRQISNSVMFASAILCTVASENFRCEFSL